MSVSCDRLHLIFFDKGTTNSARKLDHEFPVSTTSRIDSTVVSTVVDSTVVSAGIAAPGESDAWSWSAIRWSWWNVLQLISAVLGIVGNFLVMLVLFVRRSSSRSTDFLVGALAQADFLTSVFLLPLPAASTAPRSTLGHLYCWVVYPQFLMFVCVTVSIYILMAISLERFVAVVYPLVFNRLVNRRLILVLVALIWIGTSAVYAAFLPIVYGVDPDRRVCTVRFASPNTGIVLGSFLLCYRLLFPTGVMIITQIWIVRSLQRQAVLFREQKAVSFHRTARNRVLKLMTTIIAIYVVCWSPGQIAFFLVNIGVLDYSFVGSPLDRGAIVLSFYNSCLNPVIYTARFPEFRQALKSIFRQRDADLNVPLFDERKRDWTESGRDKSGQV
ncbi:allatostatin-A receptor-like [Diadema antillarum]|uniref:allatostatin-A receptor-like n=1 Tax=Diadema antillarum TaxID=105358 RepID=UPI003A86E0CC